MASAQRVTKPPQTVRGGIPSDGSDGDCNPEKESSGPVTARRPKSRASRKSSSKQNGEQPKNRHDGGKLSKLPGMPLDVLHDVSCRVDPVTNSGMMHLAFSDIFFCPSDGSTENFVGQQGLLQSPRDQGLETGLGGRLREYPPSPTATCVPWRYNRICVRKPAVQPAVYGVYVSVFRLTWLICKGRVVAYRGTRHIGRLA
jgi:hypothetical protein